MRGSNRRREVARVRAAVERAELVAHGVLETEYQADSQHSRLGLAPVHAHVNVDLVAVGGGHFKASELVDAEQLCRRRGRPRGGPAQRRRQRKKSATGRHPRFGRSTRPCSRLAPDPASTKLVPSRDRRATPVISRCGYSASLTPLLPVRGTGSPKDSGRDWTRSAWATIREEASG